MTKKKRRTKGKAKKDPIKDVELAIEKAQRTLADEGNTDEVEDLLDEIEHRINSMKQRHVKRLVIDELKSKLDKIK